ncbi:hypothetical protein D3C87_1493620 [compost metagenome]
MGQHPLRHARVVANQLDLRDACGFVDDTVRIGDLDSADAVRRHGSLDRLSPGRLSRMIGAQALERGLAYLAFRGPLGKLDFCNEGRFHPTYNAFPASAPSPAGTRLRRKGTSLSFQGGQASSEFCCRRAVPAGSNAADVTEFSIRIYAKQ